MKWLKDLFGKASSAVPRQQHRRRSPLAPPHRGSRSRTSERRFHIVVDVEISGLNMVQDNTVSIGAVAVCEVIDAELQG